MALGAWFVADYFAGQKLEQIKVLQQMGKFDFTVPETGTNEQKLQSVIDQWNAVPGNEQVSIESNFTECNRGDYIVSAVARDQINVSPNELFDIPYYLTALAKNANDTGYTAGDVAAGSWTAENVLQHMYAGGYSAWSHFMGDGLDRMIDCSSSFNTKAYLEDKAVATNQTVEKVIADMKAAGRNPVMDYYEEGRDLGIEIKPVETALTVSMKTDALWVDGGIVPPADVDPYEVDVTPVAIEAGNYGPYTSEDGVNTRFEAVWVGTTGVDTLAATDVINAGEAFNTLAIELGQDWRGFDNSALGKGVDNVTGVGRIVLNRQEAGSERHLSFDATNISEDTHRFDINAKGTGSTDLKNLSDAVNEINLSGLKAQDVGTGSGKIQSTNLNFVRDAKTGTADTLTIGLTDVGAAATPEEVTWNAGIETVIVNSKARSIAGQNAVDIYKATGVKEVDVTGDAAVTVRTNAEDVTKYDMSDAKGQVNLNAYNLSNQTVTGGQHAEDGVNLLSSGNVTASKWTGVENVTFGAGVSDSIIFNAADSQDINAYWIAGGGTYKAINVADDDLIVYQTKGAADTTKPTTINGTMNNGDSSLNNVTWQSRTGWTVSEQKEHSGVKANFESNADGTATIRLDGTDYLQIGSKFEFDNASKVVIDSQNDNDNAGGVAADMISLIAPKATEMTVDWTGAAAFGETNAGPSSTALGKLENLTLNLEDASAGTPDVFNLGFYSLGSAQNVTVHGGGESVTLCDLGTTTGTSDLTLKADNVADFFVGDMAVGLGYNVDANISASGVVKLGNITSSTNAQSNYQGDVNLTVSGDSVQRWDTTAGSIDITGGELNIDFSGVTGGVGSYGLYAVALDAMEGINYTGAAGRDIVRVNGAGAAGSSTISTGGGNDQVRIGAGALADESNLTVNLGSGVDEIEIEEGAVVAQGVATVNVICGEGADKLGIDTKSAGDNLNAKTRLIVNVEGFEEGVDKIVASSIGGAIANEDDMEDMISKFGINLTGGELISLASSGQGYYVGDDLYMVSASYNTTLIVLHGVDASSGFAVS